MKRFFVFKWVLIINCYLLIINCLSSCNGKINIVENSDGTKSVNGTLGFSKAAADELLSIMQAAGGSSSDGAALISGEEISAFLTSMGGKNVKASSKSNNNYNFSATMPKDFEITPKKCVEFYESLDEESKMYADLLMAPIFTGEKMAVDEYEELLASVYGAAFAKEFVSGKIEISGKSKKVISAGKFFCGLE